MPNSQALEKRFGLQERQAQCAALQGRGGNPKEVAEVLDVSASTLESHFSALRRVFNCRTTDRLRLALGDLISDEEMAAFHCWPTGTNASVGLAVLDTSLAERLRTCVSLEQALGALKDSLAPLGAIHIYYCFIPHSVQGVLRGDLIDTFLAPEEVEEAFHRSGGLIEQPIAQRLFDAPTDIPLVSLDLEGSQQHVKEFYDVCRKHDATHMMGLGFPSGPGFVGFALTLSLPTKNAVKKANDQGELIRKSALATHAALLTNGVLAAKYRLSVRERDVLSKIALGRRNAEVASELGVSERGLTKLLASARGKMNARTNTEAAVKAALVNALVFL